MNSADKKLFGDAILESLSRKYERELAEMADGVICSEEHVRRVSEIVENALAQERKRSCVRWISILVAAALLLAGCSAAIVYRRQIGSFIEQIYEEYIHVSFNDEQGHSEIKEVYTLTYLPVGYEMTNQVISEGCVFYEYSDSNGNYLSFEQYPVGVYFHIDNDSGQAIYAEYNDIEVYIKTTDQYSYNIWSDDKYHMMLTSSRLLTDDEMLKLLIGIE